MLPWYAGEEEKERCVDTEMGVGSCRRGGKEGEVRTGPLLTHRGVHVPWCYQRKTFETGALPCSVCVHRVQNKGFRHGLGGHALLDPPSWSTHSWHLIRAHEIIDEDEVRQCRRVQSCPAGTLKGPGCGTRTPVPSFTRTWNLGKMKLLDKPHFLMYTFPVCRS